MQVNGKHYRTIWRSAEDPTRISIIDQRNLPHQFVIETIDSVEEMARAISEMHIRGAVAIGVAAAFGMELAAREAAASSDFATSFADSATRLKNTRPTAVNLQWAVDRQLDHVLARTSADEGIEAAMTLADKIASEELDRCRQMGQHGLPLLQSLADRKGRPVNILTHCNAGWLACVDYGTATAPIYAAQEAGIALHVWVDETRPRNQGARLTAWELGQQGVPHTVVCDNTGGHLMQQGMVDIVLVGSDRTSYCGDVANKIGTYLKALAAYDNEIPFYAVLPSSTIDWDHPDGIKDFPIEQRDQGEVRYARGAVDGELREVLLCPADSGAANYAFDVTPARLLSGLISERGICSATEEGIRSLYPEGRHAGS